MNPDRRFWIGLGEVLWDVLPDARHLGGAPANFAYHAAMLGAYSTVASRVGADALGRQAITSLQQLGVETHYVQVDEAHPTGTVNVQVDEAGQPRYTITEDVAWDYLTWTEQWQELAERADVICWGSLAQRSLPSRNTIHQFLQSTRPNALLIFDVNLRQRFYTREVLAESLKLSSVVKINDEELPRVVNLLDGDSSKTPEQSARWLIQNYDLALVCLTRGAHGSLIITNSEKFEHPGFRAKVVDTVGAGDAFTAALAHHYLRGASLKRISEAANVFGAWVATQSGATPAADQRVLRQVIGESARV